MNIDSLDEAEGIEGNGYEQVDVNRIEQDLENSIQGHKTNGYFPVSFRQLVPDDDHGDATGQADKDDADHILRIVPEEDHRQKPHDYRSDDPILEQREDKELFVLESLPYFLVFDANQGWIHHENQADGNGNRGGPDLHLHDEAGDAGKEISDADAQSNGDKNP